tara:strand:+ start:25 stop:324 length:300 start_codon:yes stop_codon:yes gene_type:complete
MKIEKELSEKDIFNIKENPFDNASHIKKSGQVLHQEIQVKYLNWNSDAYLEVDEENPEGKWRISGGRGAPQEEISIEENNLSELFNDIKALLEKYNETN